MNIFFKPRIMQVFEDAIKPDGMKCEMLKNKKSPNEIFFKGKGVMKDDKQN